MPKRVTIKDVAKEAGVSFKTVSNVLNNTGSMRASTRERVEDAIVKLGYAVNLSARSLKTGTTGLIGLSIFDFSQPFAPYLSDQVIDYARQRGYGVIVNTYGQGGDGLASVMDNAAMLAADGWFVFIDQPLANEGALLEQPYPLVVASDYESYGKVDKVTMPNVEGVRQATGRLLDAGCRSIALFGACEGNRDYDYYMNASEGTQEMRVRGYNRAFEERGLRPDMNMLFSWGLMMSDSGVHAVNHMLQQGVRPEAIVCLNDAMAIGTLHGLEANGLRVPDDVQIIGYDNVPESQFSNPSLTTIDPHVRDYVEHGIDMLIERIQGYDGPARTYTTDFTLVERGSTKLSR